MRKTVLGILLSIVTLALSQQVYSYDVTAGQSGAWYDPSHDGEGYFLQVFWWNSCIESTL